MTNKLKYFVGNWKMFGDFSSLKIISKINLFGVKFRKDYKNFRIIMCVPNTLIYYFASKLKKSFLSVGAQNCHYLNTSGPFTGSVNASMLKSNGAKFVILGHSDNRTEGDTNLIIKKKIESALDQKLNVIFCIGETLKEKNKKKTFSLLRKQIKESLSQRYDFKKIIIAYEPVWCIGTGKIPNTIELKKIFKFIKKEFKRKLNTKKNPLVLYGGSVNERNIRFFSSNSEIDGFLVGGASQSSKKFIDIIKNYYK